MSADDILDAILRHHSGAAIVPEVTIADDYWLDYWQAGTPGLGTARRIDALMWESRQITAIEIKVSVADFDRDIWQKRLPWQRVANRFVYATPKGLLTDKRGMYHGCGLWEVDDDGRVTVAQRAKINATPEPLPLSVVQCLAYRASKSAVQP